MIKEIRSQCKIISDILAEFKSLPQLDDIRSSEGWVLPPSIYIGDGKFIFITDKLKKLLNEFADVMIGQYKLKSSYTFEEWCNMVRNVSGPIVVERMYKVKDSKDAKSLAVKIVSEVLSKIEGRLECEYAFGCHFSRVDTDPFVVGPVRFESRLAWISRLRDSGVATDIDKRRLKRVWNDKPLRPRKKRSSFDESSAIDITKDAPFVCSVKVGPMGPEMGQQKALVAAQLATAAISLAWTNSSSVLNDINLTYDRLPQARCYFVSTGNRSGGGSTASYLPGGVRAAPESWSEVRSDFGDMIECAGEAIRLVTHGKSEVHQPKMMEALYQSLLWFYKGCRESISPIAVAHFCTSLDALAKGEKGKGILQLMKTQLQLNDRGEEEVNENLNRIYGKGRNFTLHGNKKDLDSDWTRDKAISEFYARECLISCLRWVAEHPDSDDPKCLRGE